MDFLTQFADIIANNWDKVLLWITTPVVGGLSIWKIGNIIVSAIKKATEKKYTKKIEEYHDRISSEVASLKTAMEETIKAEVASYAETIKDTFNELQTKTQETKQKIYEQLENGELATSEIVEDMKTDISNEINTLAEEVPEAPTTEQVTEAVNEVTKQVTDYVIDEEAELVGTVEETKKVDLV